MAKEGWINYMELSETLEEAENWLPKAEHVDIVHVREVLLDTVTITRETLRSILDNQNFSTETRDSDIDEIIFDLFGGHEPTEAPKAATTRKGK